MGVKTHVVTEGVVNYVEPNYSNADFRQNRIYNDENGYMIDSSYTSVYNLPPDLEDMSIYVNLKVDLFERGGGGIVSHDGTNTHLMTWNGKTGQVSFLRGTNFEYGKRHLEGNDVVLEFDETTQYFSTAPYECTTYRDIDTMNNANSEMFGIKSIDISYNNYNVPEVTINFTDIRGMSLIGAEELRHTFNSNGIQNSVDESVSGSFFKAFFMFPYPKFELMVKGFYGKPTTYQLTCSGFKTRFDCSTGNFEATATFLGYNHALLNDVMLTAIVCATRDRFYGKQYWDAKVDDSENSGFYFDSKDGIHVPMKGHDVLDIVGSIPSINEKLIKFSQDDESVITMNKAEEAKASIASYIDALRGLYKSITASCKDEVFEAKNGINDNATEAVYIYVKDAIINNGVFVNDVVKSKVIVVEEQRKRLEEAMSDCPPPTVEYISEITTSDKLTQLKESSKYPKEKYDDLQDSWHVYKVDYQGVISTLEQQKLTYEAKSAEAQVEVENKKTELIKNVLGFEQTIENFTKLFLCQMETLIHAIYTVEDTVKGINESSNKRTLQSMSNGKDTLSSVDINDDNIIGGIPAFPRVEVIKQKASGSTKEEGWIGNVTTDDMAPEINLIHGLLEAVTDARTAFDKVNQEMQSQAEEAKANGESQNKNDVGVVNGRTSTVAEQIASVIDVITNNEPFLKVDDFSDYGDIFGKVANRFFGSVGLNSRNSNYTDASEELGKADAINFAHVNKSPDKDFLTKLNNNGFNADEIVNGLADKNTSLKKEGGGYAWNKGGASRSGGMITINGNNSRYTLTGNAIIPLGNASWENIHNAKHENYFYYNGNGSEKKGTENLFVISDKYARFQALENSFTRGNDAFSNIKKIFGQNYNVTTKYLTDKPSSLAKKFTASVPNLNFDDIAEGSYIFPNDKSLISSIKESRFIDKNGINDLGNSFGSIKLKSGSYSRNGGSFETLYSNLNDIGSYTIPSFNGFKVNDKHLEVINTCSLFGQVNYYANKENRKAKALLFLESFSNSYDISRFVEEITSTYNILSFTPKIIVLLCGAYIEFNRNDFGVSFGGVNFNREETLCGKEIKSLFSLKENIKTLFTKKFDEWVDTEFSSIQEAYELRPNNNGVTEETFIKEMTEALSSKEKLRTLFNLAKSLLGKETENVYTVYTSCYNEKYKTHYKTFEALLAAKFNENFFNNYISINGDEYGLKLFNRETSKVCNDVVKLLGNVNAVIKTSQYISSNADYIETKTSHLKNYINGFIKQLKTEYESASNAANDSNNSNSTHIGAGQMVNSEASEDIKIALYRYIKLLYDRWLSGNPQDNWDVNKFFQHWHFIDSYYNVIGDLVYVNIINDFYEKLKASFNQPGYSIMSYINDLFSTCRMNFNCVQNFLDLTDGQNIKELFDPIPTNNINWGDVDYTPDFVAIYHGDESSKINLDKSSFKDDSFNFNVSIAEQPEAIKSKQIDVNLEKGQRHKVGYKIPAFGVTYGMQHQSYFKNIDVSMDSAMVTQQAIETQFIIGEQNSTTDVEHGRLIQSVGQDLYTIYSNNSYSCTVSMMGCAYIQPLMYFQLNNIPLFRGAYLIHKVNHHIEPGNMETSFVGVRQSAVQTPFIKNPFVERRNGKTYDGRDEYGDEMERNGQMAAIENNCQYKAFAVLSGQGASIDVDVPISSVSKKAAELYPNETLLDVLARTVYAAVDSTDELSCQLTATVYYNRYANKKNWDSADLFGGVQIEWKEPKAQSADLKTEAINKIKRYIRPIFESSPSYLVGRQNRIFKSVPIYRNSKKTDENTKSGVAITIDVLKRIYFYASPYRYLKTEKVGDKKVTRKYKPLGGEYSEEVGKHNKNCAHFITHEYGIQQDIDETQGHVYLCLEKDCWTEQTNKSNKDSKKENKNPSELAEGLFNAAKKSAEFSAEASKKVINMKYKPTSDANVIIITSDSKEGNAYIYDILLNTYYDYISKLLWVSSDNKSVPSEIVVGVKEAATKNTKKLIGISNDGVQCCAFGDNDISFVEGKDKNINHLFLTILRKHYGIIPNDGSGDFKLDCANFTTFTKGRAIDWVDKINNVLKNDIMGCGNQSASYDSMIMEGPNIPKSDVKNPKMLTVLNSCKYLDAPNHKPKPLVNYDIEANGMNSYQGVCVRGPITWYGKAGMTLDFWGANAKGATDANFTHDNNWELVGSYEVSEQNMIGQGLKPGDIAVMYSARPTSHGCMWDGEHWRSDTIQSKCWPYSNDKVGRRSTNPLTKKPIQIWRYMPWQ